MMYDSPWRNNCELVCSQSSMDIATYFPLCVRQGGPDLMSKIKMAILYLHLLIHLLPHLKDKIHFTTVNIFVIVIYSNCVQLVGLLSLFSVAAGT